jgi:hypothetical protein
MKGKEILAQYLPAGAVDQVFEWIVKYKVHFKITKSRKTKLGDYRSPLPNANHRVTVNHNLNQYAFLITFVHELAHLIVFEEYGRRVAPHGNEWKNEYKRRLTYFLTPEIFPEDILKVLIKSVSKIKASSTSDLALSRILRRYDPPTDEIKLEDVATNTVFIIQNGKQFIKGERIRTRYKCQSLQNKKYYLFHPLTPIIPAAK